MTRETPTRLADGARPGDTVRAVNGSMRGVVLRVLPRLSLPVAVVRWENGAEGRHTLTTLKVVPPVSPRNAVRGTA